MYKIRYYSTKSEKTPKSEVVNQFLRKCHVIGLSLSSVIKNLIDWFNAKRVVIPFLLVLTLLISLYLVFLQIGAIPFFYYLLAKFAGGEGFLFCSKTNWMLGDACLGD